MGKYAEVRLAGFGGQGIILAGILLAEAAGVYDNYFAVQTQSYGPTDGHPTPTFSNPEHRLFGAGRLLLVY